MKSNPTNQVFFWFTQSPIC